jgi:glutamyl-tRNA reductase
MLKQLKVKLKELYAHPQYVQTITCPKKIDVHIQRVLNDTAGKIKLQNQRGCQYLSALNNFINSSN